MKTPSRFRHLATLTAAAVMTLLIVVTAPASAVAGCSQHVTSRADRARLPSFMQPVEAGRAEGEYGRPDPLSIPPRPGRCQGAWCDGQPAAPTAPSGALEVRVDGWAWTASNRRLPAHMSALFSPHGCDPRPTRRGSAILRPPRIVSPLENQSAQAK